MVDNVYYVNSHSTASLKAIARTLGFEADGWRGYWAAWYALRYRHPISLPVAEAAVVQFIVDHAQRLEDDGRLVRVSVLSKAHQVEDATNPCEQVRVRELLSKTRRGHVKRGPLPHKKPALTREPLEALLETCEASLAGLRDRALLLFAFSSGGRRRSEVTAATMENTRRNGAAFLVETLATKPTLPMASKATRSGLRITGQVQSRLPEVRRRPRSGGWTPCAPCRRCRRRALPPSRLAPRRRPPPPACACPACQPRT